MYLYCIGVSPTDSKSSENLKFTVYLNNFAALITGAECNPALRARFMLLF